MIEDTIGKIEDRLRSTDAVKEDRRRELLQLLGTLKSEVAELSKTHGEQAQSIAGFTDVSTYEATRAEQNPKGWAPRCEDSRSLTPGLFKSSTPSAARWRTWGSDVNREA